MAPLSNVPPPTDEPPEWHFGDAAHDVYPVGSSGRLARILDVNQRLVQRWIAGEQEPTNRASDYLRAQEQAVIRAQPAAELERLVERWSAEGMDNEAIGAHFAAMYESLLGRQIT